MATDAGDPAPTGRPATSVDVARLAGVSQATVSYVLNDAPGVTISEATRARVRAAADELGYAPDASARTLRTGRSDVVLMPLPVTPLGTLFLGLLNELMERLREHGLTFVLYGDARSRGVAAARDWMRWRPAAVIVEGDRLTAASVRRLHDGGCATVIGYGPAPSPLVPTMLIDDAAIGACAARHLLGRGRRDLAAVVPAEPGLDAFGERRLAGMRAAAEEAGAAARRVDLPFDEDAAARLAADWVAGTGRPDGVFAYNDDYAMLLMRALQDAGLDVPRDVAVVGADDLPVARFLRPRLSTVRVRGDVTPAGLAERLARMVAERDRDPAVTVSLTRVEMVPRESS
ncbi:LacI family DNA-binding transcriptional regulator [Actinomadura opuntiae]|uniref:LacI family DNA-binding transcriptional regulator n=1 Tax=Actinomadura sp. OS1-43 TaxID=604315 RepID=UPI00255B2836|nr:LacI family DNA-binding transcriptional regulator [Actinomadura sp. OS1-43]MDL4813025.1 LacI family DNA-binding transcriptional regulator [Actinomadura sp. OS1-43]